MEDACRGSAAGGRGLRGLMLSAERDVNRGAQPEFAVGIVAVEDDEGGLHMTYDTGRQNIVYCYLPPEFIAGALSDMDIPIAAGASLG